MTLSIDMDKIIKIRRKLHQIPELGFEEYKTQALLLDYISQLPQTHLEVRTWRTGVIVNIKGLNPRRRFGFRADMDGLPITEDTNLAFISKHDGLMHACGHDMHMAIALGILSHFALQPIADDITIIFQPAEEGPGGALPMLACQELTDWMPDLIIALHIAPEYPLGSIAIKPGILFANTSEVSIKLTGKGGHAAYPHQANDMIIAACQLVNQLQTIVSRNVNPLDSAVVTIGKITTGTRRNIIAESALLDGTIRTLSAESTEIVKQRIAAIVRGIEISFNCQSEIIYGPYYKYVNNEQAETDQFMKWVRQVEEVQLEECSAAMTGEDFGFFLERIPGFMFWLGVDSHYGLHHAKIVPDERAIEVAIGLITRYFSWKSSLN